MSTSQYPRVRPAHVEDPLDEALEEMYEREGLYVMLAGRDDGLRDVE